MHVHAVRAVFYRVVDPLKAVIAIDVLEAVRHHAESADEVDGQPASSRR